MRQYKAVSREGGVLPGDGEAILRTGRSLRRRYATLSWLRGHADLLVVLALGLVALGLMLPYLSREVVPWPRSGLGTDFMAYRWSHAYYLRESLRHFGVIPTWRGTVMGGEPMVGNPSVMLSYPPHLLITLLPIPLLPGFALQTALHLWLAGIGGYVLLHSALGLRRPIAALGALAIMLAPRLSSNAVGDIGLTYAMCWMPLTLAWAMLAIDGGRWTWTVVAGLGLACQYLLHVHIFFYTAWIIGLYFAYRFAVALLAWYRSAHRSAFARTWLARAGGLALMALVCAGLVAFELLPFLSYLPSLSREALTAVEANYYALPPAMLAALAMPSPGKFPEWELYVGLLPLLLAPLAFLHPRRGEVGFWAGLALFAALFSLGTATPLFPFLFHYVPGFSWLRVPARMWCAAALAAVVLACLGLDVVVRSFPRARWCVRAERWLLLGGWTLLVATIAGRWLTRQPGELDWMLGGAGALGTVLGLAGVWLRMRGQIGDAVLYAALAGGLLLDLVPVDLAYGTPRPAEQVFRLPPIARHLRSAQAQAAGPFRVYSVREIVRYHMITQEGLEAVDGINSFQFQPYIEYIKRASGCDLPGFASSVPPCLTNEVSAAAYRRAVPDPSLLGLFNVRYVITPVTLAGPEWSLRDQVDGIYLYENRQALPRAFGVGRVEAVPDRPALWERLAQVDVAQVALVDGERPGAALPTAPFHAPAEVLEYGPNGMRIQVEMPGDGMLLVSTPWTPGWQARENAAPLAVHRVNGAMQGIYLKAGSHQVVLRFLPSSLLRGLAISVLTLLACGLAVARFRVPPAG